VRLHRLDEKREDPFPLDSSGLDDSQDALREPKATIASRAKATLAPQHALSQHALSVVVRRLYAVVTQKGPKRWFQVEKVLAKRSPLPLRNAHAAVEESSELPPDRLESRLEGGAVDSTLLEVPPDHKNLGPRHNLWARKTRQ
jgi:hypothetical protein